MTQNPDTESLKRTCAVCGDEITITVNEDGTYEGGHYWDFDPEYWECEDCYGEIR